MNFFKFLGQSSPNSCLNESERSVAGGGGAGGGWSVIKGHCVGSRWCGPGGGPAHTPPQRRVGQEAKWSGSLWSETKPNKQNTPSRTHQPRGPRGPGPLHNPQQRPGTERSHRVTGGMKISPFYHRLRGSTTEGRPDLGLSISIGPLTPSLTLTLSLCL